MITLLALTALAVFALVIVDRAQRTKRDALVARYAAQRLHKLQRGIALPYQDKRAIRWAIVNASQFDIYAISDKLAR